MLLKNLKLIIYFIKLCLYSLKRSIYTVSNYGFCFRVLYEPKVKIELDAIDWLGCCMGWKDGYFARGWYGFGEDGGNRRIGGVGGVGDLGELEEMVNFRELRKWRF